MESLLKSILRYRTIMLILLAAIMVAGAGIAYQLDVEAYPDPSPPLVEIITQNPDWSAEEIERQVTVPIETGLSGTPHLDQVRSVSIFGLSDVKLYFSFDSDYFRDRQEVLNRLSSVDLPNNVKPELSPWSPIGEIYRYEVTGPYSLNELKATQDWVIRRELKKVNGIVDITTFGGTTKQYQIEPDPNKLLAAGVTLQQLITAVQNSNANAGGNYITMGEQNLNVRSIGLLKDIDDIGNVVVATHNGTPVLVRDVAALHEGFQQRLGKIGRGNNPDIIEAIVLLQKGEESMPALKGLRQHIDELNHNGLLPPGMHIKTLIDRGVLIEHTTETVKHVILTGLFLVTLVLLCMLGDLRITLIAAVTIPFAVIFSFAMMVLTGHAANLISIGAIDFGILVDASIVVLESIHRNMVHRKPGQRTSQLIIQGVQDAGRPVLFSTLIILVAFIPLFTMQGVPGKIFAPMSVTYGFALTGALLFAMLFAPVLSLVTAKKDTGGAHGDDSTWLTRWMQKCYRKALHYALNLPKLTWLVAAASLVLAGALFSFFIGGEFMPPLEEGNLWIRATLPQDISFQKSTALADQIRATLHTFPEVTQIISQSGRPDDGTDVSTFNNIEVLADLKPVSQWDPKYHGNKDELINAMQHSFSKFPGVIFGFSQAIQDNVEEAMSGVKGENSLKLFGDDLDELTRLADLIQKTMSSVRGVKDVGVFNVSGQPALVVKVDRQKASRYGVVPADVNASIQAAVGGDAITQLMEGERRFDVTVRYPEQYRTTPEEVSNILLPAADGSKVPLSQVADVGIRQGSFMIYREGGRRYIPIKFSVRDRDLASTIEELQQVLAAKVKLPAGYNYTWAGEFDSLQKEQKRLALVIPISLLVVLFLLYLQFRSWKDAFIVMAALPFAETGGMAALWLTHTAFSISAAVGFTSLTGVATLAAVVFLSGIRRAQSNNPENGLLEGCYDEMRPVMMACLCAGLGLLPAAIMNGIGAQAQQPLARVVVGGMVTTVPAVLLLLPLMARRPPEPEPEEETE